MTWQTLTNLDHDKFNYYPFMISLDKYNDSFNNAVDDLTVEVLFQVKQMV